MEPDQLDDPVLYRQELIKTHSRRLKALENRQALLGYGADVSIELEIAEIKEKIAKLGGQIDEFARLRQIADDYKINIKNNRIKELTIRINSQRYLIREMELRERDSLKKIDLRSAKHEAEEIIEAAEREIKLLRNS